VASERLKLLQRAIEVTFKRHRSEPQRAIEASFVKGMTSVMPQNATKKGRALAPATFRAASPWLMVLQSRKLDNISLNMAFWQS
jgi:hypothetical protein